MEDQKPPFTPPEPETKAPAPPIPFKRNWLEEAYKIFRGDMRIKPKREHITAVMASLIDFQHETKKLRDLMMTAYQQACKRRKEQGLPIPEPPPGMEHWKGEKN